MKKMKYIGIRLVLQFAIVSLFTVSLTLSPANGISTNREDDVQEEEEEERDGFCSLSDQQDGNCKQHDDLDKDTKQNDIDENHLQNLFEQAMKATQSQDWQESPHLSSL